MVFESVLDIVSAERGEVKRSWFVEWFYGNTLKAYWTEVNIGGGSSAMADEINDGFFMTTNINFNDRRGIEFNQIRHYDNTGLTVIWIGKVDSVTDTLLRLGVTNVTQFGGNSMFGGIDDNSSVNFILRTADDIAGITTVASSILADTDFHKHQCELFPTFAQYTLDGLLEATSTTTLPTAQLQPSANILTKAGAKTANVRFLSVFNK